MVQERCNVCGKECVDSVFAFADYPLVLRPIPDELVSFAEKQDIPRTVELDYVHCTQCGHVFLRTPLEERVENALYSSFYETYPASDIEETATQAFVKAFRSCFERDGSPRRVLEIGCSDGGGLQALDGPGWELYGCDPSPRALKAQERGLNVKRDFFSPELYSGLSFDVICSRHVIEHIKNPFDFLEGQARMLTQGGKLVIETPNGEFCMSRGLLDSFHPEHVSLFTIPSLDYLLGQLGFQIEYVDDRTQNLIVCASRIADSSPEKALKSNLDYASKLAVEFSETYSSWRNELQTHVTELAESEESVAMWGAGSSGVRVLALFPEIIERAVLVDRDESKQGLRFYHLDKRVLPPVACKEQDVDAIIISSQYVDAICKDIRKLGVDSKILGITPYVRWIDG